MIFFHGGAVDNTGTINATGSGNRGVYLVNGGTVTNSSAITATAASGIGVGSKFSGNGQQPERGDDQRGCRRRPDRQRDRVGDQWRADFDQPGRLWRRPQGRGRRVANQRGGTISGVGAGVYVGGGSAAANVVTNAGSISGTAANGMGVCGPRRHGENESGGTITGAAFGVFLTGGTSTLNNAGDVYGAAASGSGAALGDGGTVTNTEDRRRQALAFRGRGRRLGDELGRDHGDVVKEGSPSSAAAR